MEKKILKNNGMQDICKELPKGWEEAAKNEGALMRSRNIQTAKELLRLNLLYQTIPGGSYALTSAITQISKDQKGLNKTAVQKRITNSGNWLKWMCEHICLEEGYIAPKPKWLDKYRVCAVDASDYSVMGSRGTDFRLHYMMDLFSMNAIEMHFTTAKEGERLSRYTKIQESDLLLADRVYGTVSGMKYLIDRRADFVLRIKSTCFKLYDSNGEEYDLTTKLANGDIEKFFEKHLYFKCGKELYPIRICVLKKSKEDVEKSIRHIKESNGGSRKLSELQKTWCNYVVVATSLSNEITITQILELYRMRWQIELVFKRFKSIFCGGEFTARKEDAVRAWFYGKLLLALLCEKIAKRSVFPPNGC